MHDSPSFKFPASHHLLSFQAISDRFEQLAGRSAMLGVSVALLLELALGQSIAPPSENLQTFSLTIIATIFTSGLYALLISGEETKRGELFLEGVLASMTSIHRSKSSITAPLNSALDVVVDQIVVGLPIHHEDQA